MKDKEIFTLKWEAGALVLIDQTKLPTVVEFVHINTVEGVFEAIKTMIVRGAPAIGVTAGYGMVIAAKAATRESFEGFFEDISRSGDYLVSARPTAVNLPWAVQRMLDKAEAMKDHSISDIIEALEQEAIDIHHGDEAINQKLGENLLSLLKDGDGVLTHCNAGALATSKYGTALSPFYLAKEKGMDIKAYADETRPRLQGATLTAFELQNAGVDVTLICDNMAAVVMAQGKINAVIVGCDRVAANGDTANKIGTFGVSVLAKYFDIPMYIAAPTPTIDTGCATGADIPIEERDEKEITERFGLRTAPKGIKTYNPAFDVTPAKNITAIVTEKGTVYPPFKEGLASLLKD
ncbi:MAG: S-methyl-5-thioribose-1-phosphate isomerase [Eubacteriales bacterium]